MKTNKDTHNKKSSIQKPSKRLPAGGLVQTLLVDSTIDEIANYPEEFDINYFKNISTKSFFQ